MDTNNKTQTLKVFNQIDYIIRRAAQKSILQNTRSYAGTKVSSDYQLVVTKMRIERFYFYKKNKVKFDAPVDTNRLQRLEVPRKYSEQLQKESRRRSTQMTKKIVMMLLRRS